ncbi:MAG: hypothetical protein KatS3mg011_1614 [Acidimicrobiia bacterium]|nr:MAG: hypothetical protein KatS3mg011_1614 [Acidimicrobiia bacterium]
MARALLATIDHRVEPDSLRVEVTLGWRDVAYVGSALGEPDQRHLPRLVGEATLDAVRRIDGSRLFELEAVGWSELGDLRVAVAQVREPGKGDLVGSALVRSGDGLAAVAKAVLDAINRRITD